MYKYKLACRSRNEKVMGGEEGGQVNIWAMAIYNWIIF